MMKRSYLLMVLAIFALLLMVSLQGCLFGGGASDEASNGNAGAAPAEGATSTEGGGEAAAPAEGGGEMMGGGPGAAPAEPGSDAGPGEGTDAGMPMGGGEMGMGGEAAAPATGSGGAAALNAKHSGDWSGARAQCEAALKANPKDAEANRVLAWILADTDAAGAIEHFKAYLASGATGPDADEAKAAIERLQ